MPKVAYSEAEKAQVREALLTKGLDLLAKQEYSIRLWNKSTRR